MIETVHTRGRGTRVQGASSGRGHSKNKKWVAGQDNSASASGHSSDGERWERGTHRKKYTGRGRGRPSETHLTVPSGNEHEELTSGAEDEHSADDDVLTEVEDDAPAEPEPELDTLQERERFWQELVKARDAERKKAIAEGKMDDPAVAKPLSEAITMVGTCMEMCPRFERYRRERENNLDKWEVIPGTKRVDHKRAVKIYERAAGDKTLPSDLRPPPVLKKTLDYLFHDLLLRGGFSQTYDFIRDRSRSVRSDFTMQHEQGPLAIECHDRCARFHILALHHERDNPRFSVALEEQQLMNTLQSLKEFYSDQRGKYQAPTELEMRVYHRLIHIRDQRERREDIPEEITVHPVFQYMTQFRLHVQAKSAPITKNSRLVVDAEGMQIFGQLAAVLRKQGNVVMIYLVACILERLFGKDTIDDIESIRGELSIPEVIDGISQPAAQTVLPPASASALPSSIPAASASTSPTIPAVTAPSAAFATSSPSPFGATSKTPSVFGNANSFVASVDSQTQSASVQSAFANLKSTPNAFGGSSAFVASAFGGSSGTSIFGAQSKPSASVTTPPKPASSIFGNVSFGGSNSTPPAFSSSKPSTPIFSGVANGIPAAACQPATAQLSPLNPFAPSFSPVRPPPPPFATPPARAAPGPPSSSAIPLKTDPIPSPSASFVTHSPTSTPPASIFPTSPPKFSWTTPPATGSPVKLPTAPSPAPRIIEKRQTLWEIPSTSSPHPQTPPQINTNVSTLPARTSTQNAPVTPTTPIVPPPPPKVQPLSLPPTPTARWFDPNSQQASGSSSPVKTKSIFGFPPLQMPTVSTSAEMLSPLHLNSPTKSLLLPNVSLSNASPTPAQRTHASSPLVRTPREEKTEPVAIVNGFASPKGKGKEVVQELESKVAEFCNTRLLGPTFKRWKDKTIARAAWVEACNRSDAYKAKVQRERLSTSFSTGSIPSKSTPEEKKRRRVSAIDSSQMRRTKRRVIPRYSQPLTDEQLALRLRENHEEHQRRWAQGSFLQAIRTRVANTSPNHRAPEEWRLWLSMNPENDRTAIWLEHKFDVPAAGVWDSQTVFSIPAQAGSSSRGAPGLIVFERTPLEGLADEIERKYRVLDDCARLRDIIESFPDPRSPRFTPSLVVIQWAETIDSEVILDFHKMTEKLAADEVLQSVSTIVMSSTTKDLDGKFASLLAEIDLDVTDKQMVEISWKELTSRVVEPFRNIVSDWLDACWVDETLDWYRFGHVSQAIKDMQTEVACTLLRAVGKTARVEVQTPVDLESPAHLGKGYMMGPFLDAHVTLPVATAERALRAHSSTRYELSKPTIEAAVHSVEQALQSRSDSLRELWLNAEAEDARSPPKRRAEDEVDHGESLVSSQSFKRMRSDSDSSGEPVTVNGTSSSPPASVATSTVVDGREKPHISIAMLRSLTQDVFNAYGNSPK